MDRLIAQYTVPVGSGDTAPATGTPGQATSGNPATNTPATRLPAYAWNAIQEELIAILVAAGITPDRNNNSQISVAIRRLIQSKTVLADSGTANTYAASNTPPLSALPETTGFVQVLSVGSANTGASTYAPDGLPAKPILGMGLAALQGGELPAKGVATLLYVVASTVNSGNGAWVLIECTGGAQQVGAATQSQHAAQLGQVVGVVGQSRNAKINVAAASGTATYTADELIVETGLGGLRYALANVNDTFNLATDMDTGTAPTTGFVALYRLFNPTTQATLRRIVNCTSIVAPEIYAGAAAPAGFTASALLAVLPIAGGQFAPCSLVDRTVTIVPAMAFSTINTGASYVSFSVAGQVPLNAKKTLIGAGATNTTQGASLILYVASTSTGLGAIQGVNGYAGPNVGPIEFGELPLPTPQTLFWKSSNSAGSPTFNVYVNNYSF